MQIHHVRRGAGKPLLLIHGLGGTWQAWSLILDALASEREVIAVDLPGFGETPPLPGDVSVEALTDAIAAFIDEQGLAGIDMVGNSAGAQIALELARRGVGGAVVALDPSGFGSPAQRRLVGVSLRVSNRLARALLPVTPWLTSNPVTRTLTFSQFLFRPWALPSPLALRLIQAWAVGASFDALLDSLVCGPLQQGAPAGSTHRPVVIGWGRNDRITFPNQAEKATRLFPDAQLHWFNRCGHMPHVDVPEDTIRLILDTTT